jgi:hypothetical protein
VIAAKALWWLSRCSVRPVRGFTSLRRRGRRGTPRPAGELRPRPGQTRPRAEWPRLRLEPRCCQLAALTSRTDSADTIGRTSVTRMLGVKASSNTVFAAAVKRACSSAGSRIPGVGLRRCGRPIQPPVLAEPSHFARSIGARVAGRRDVLTIPETRRRRRTAPPHFHACTASPAGISRLDAAGKLGAALSRDRR